MTHLPNHAESCENIPPLWEEIEARRDREQQWMEENITIVPLEGLQCLAELLRQKLKDNNDGPNPPPEGGMMPLPRPKTPRPGNSGEQSLSCQDKPEKKCRARYPMPVPCVPVCAL